MENWNWIEVIWTLVAVIGAYFSANNIKDGIQDLSALRLRTDSDSIEVAILNTTAWGNTRRDLMREAIQLLFGGLGIYFGFLPNGKISVLGLIISFIFIFASLLLTASALGDHFDRVKVQKLGKALLLRENDV